MQNARFKNFHFSSNCNTRLENKILIVANQHDLDDDDDDLWTTFPVVQQPIKLSLVCVINLLSYEEMQMTFALHCTQGHTHFLMSTH